MEIDAQTRLIGMEDINWDEYGQAEQTSFTDGGGISRPLRKINASHIPLPILARSVCGGATNVSDGMIKLSEMASKEVQNSESMTSDSTVSIDATANMEEKQAIVNNQKRNLGGHTLTLLFQEAINQMFNASFLFSGFYNGTIVIDLNQNTISDTANIGKIFHFQDCHCKIELKNGTIQHTLSFYGIQAERCPNIYLTNLNFIGSGGSGNYAFYGIDSDGYSSNCIFNNDNTIMIQGIIVDYVTNKTDNAINSHNASENPHPGKLATYDSLNTHNNDVNAHPNLMNAHNASHEAHPEMFVKRVGDTDITGNLTLTGDGKGGLFATSVNASGSVDTKMLFSSNGAIETRVTDGSGEPYYRWFNGSAATDIRMASDGTLYTWNSFAEENVAFKAKSLELGGERLEDVTLRLVASNIAWAELFLNSESHLCVRTPGYPSINGILHAGELVLEGVGAVGAILNSISAGRTSYPNYAAGVDILSAYQDNGKSYTFASDGWVYARVQTAGKFYINGGELPVVISSDVDQHGCFLPVKSGDVITGSSARSMTFFPNR